VEKARAQAKGILDESRREAESILEKARQEAQALNPETVALFIMVFLITGLPKA